MRVWVDVSEHYRHYGKRGLQLERMLRPHHRSRVDRLVFAHAWFRTALAVSHRRLVSSDLYDSTGNERSYADA